MRNIAIPAVGITVLSITVIGILEFFHIKPGSFVDWGIAIGGFWWLMIITTVPWNMHFRAKETVEDAQNSVNKHINVRAEDLKYAANIAKRYLWIALGLHIATAIGLYSLAYFQISEIGYFGAALAIMLTLLRPAIRLHEYIMARLSNIKVEIRHPREDVAELRNKVYEIQRQAQESAYQLNSMEANSWVSQNQREMSHLVARIDELGARMEKYQVENQKAHAELAQKSEYALQQMAEDTQFLGQARELIRFIKNA